VGVLCGLVAFAGTLTMHEKIWLFMIVGILEEFTKHLVLRFSDEEKIHSVGEAIQFSIVVALGFAFVENLQYFSNISQMSLFSWPEFMMLVALRSLVSVGAHVSFSAILGYFYGVAKFANNIYQQEVLEQRHPIIEKMHQILHLKGAVLFHEQKMMEGVLIAMVLHGIYNSLLEFGYVSFALPMVGLMIFVVLGLLHHKKLLQKNGVLVKRRFRNDSLIVAPVIPT
jgi:RsiW-degrading membrane proteinase PrsW (M82 family)